MTFHGALGSVFKMDLEKNQVSEKEVSDLKEAIQSGEHVGLRVVSGSMEPLIKTGELITVAKAVDPRVFDILVFRQKSILVCHLVKSINSFSDQNDNRVYITGGLSRLKSEDLPVPFSEVIGLVISHRLSRFMKFRLLLAWVFSRR